MKFLDVKSMANSSFIVIQTYFKSQIDSSLSSRLQKTLEDPGSSDSWEAYFKTWFEMRYA